MKALIITAHIENQDKLKIRDDYDMFICADAGYVRAKELSIKPDYLIGDYDSSALPKKEEYTNIRVLPCEKDMTDSEAALEAAVNMGCDYIDILGGLGGRFDHTMGNLGILSKYTCPNRHVALMDGQNYVFMLDPGMHTISDLGYKYIGIISYGSSASNVTIENLKYELSGYELDNSTSLGVSNEFVSGNGRISFDKGRLLIIYSDDI